MFCWLLYRVRLAVQRVDDVEGEITRGFAFASCKGDMADRLDWWTGIGQYYRLQWRDLGARYVGEVVGRQGIAGSCRIYLERNLFTDGESRLLKPSMTKWPLSAIGG